MGLLDIVGFAVDVHQSAQLYQAQQQLSHIEAGILQEAARKQVLEVLRHFVFTIGQNLKALEQQLETAPQPVHVAARTLLWRFQDIGITPEVFPEFADKEYVQQIRDKLNWLTQVSGSRLSQEQAARAELCSKFIVEMPLLHQAIEAHAATVQLQATAHIWNNLRKRRILLIILGSVLLLLSSLSFMTFCPGLLLVVFDNGPVFTLLIILLITFGIFVTGFILLLYKSVAYRNLDASRKGWQAAAPNQERWQQFSQLFGPESSDYQRLRTLREQLIQQVMSQLPGYAQLLSH